MDYKSYLDLLDKLEQGQSVFVRITDGARKDSIARVKNECSRYRFNLELEWDDREGTFSIAYKKASMIEHSGPTEWKFTYGVRKPVVDALGQEFEIGDLVYYKERGNNYFGNVCEIKATGGVYVNRLNLVHQVPNFHSSIERIINKNNCIIISDSLRDVLMLKRLKM